VTSHAVTAILIGYDEPPDLLVRAATSLRRQRLAASQMLCVGHSVDARVERAFAAYDRSIEVVPVRRDLGYPSSCNVGAACATGDYLLFLSPDAEADPDYLQPLVGACEADPTVAIAGAQVLFPGRARVNAGDNPLHLSGVSWAGRYGEAPELSPR
jgi:GT2 family glycosyltransferase